MTTYPNIIDVFSEKATQYPEALAIIDGAQQYTYAALQEKVNRLVDSLRAYENQRDELCFVLVNAPQEAIVALLSVLKSGKTFVPINPSLPDFAILKLIRQYAPDWIVIDTENEKRLNPGLKETGAKVCYSDGIFSELSINPGVKKERQNPVVLETNDPCYVYFTSGSTGEPKGVHGAFRGINHFIHWELERLQLPTHPRVSQFSAASFDVFLRDVFVPLCSGGTICIPPRKEGLIHLEGLVDWLKKNRVNLIHCVPTLFRGIIQNQKEKTRLPDLKYALLAGEKLYFEDVLNWQKCFGEDTRLVNIYGPSETSLAKFSYFIDYQHLASGVVPIGQPISDCKAILLDENLRPCTRGDVGEIYLKTPHRTLGYFRDEALTDEKFISHPALKSPGDRMYKTGDLAKINQDGDFEFVGRTDFQIKKNGVRIEPGEIEAALLEHPQVQQVAVVYDEQSEQLGAFVENDTSLSPEQLKFFLVEKIPIYMIPLYFVLGTELPKNNNGKIDRKILQKKLAETIAANKQSYVAPDSDLERELTKIWSEVLGVDTTKIGVDHNFFELGGHSLKLLEMSHLIEVHLQRKTDLLLFFKYPSIRALCDFWRTEGNETTNDQTIAETDQEDLLDIFDQGINMFNND